MTLLFAEILILSILSRHITAVVARVIGVRLTLILLLPGTIIHELSHLFIAEILGVRTGKLSLVPEGISGEYGKSGEVRVGSVAIAKTDPIRRTIIGIAPVVVGMGTLAGIAYMINTTDRSDMTNKINMIKIFQYYLLFAISNSMFSSKEDMRGVAPVFLTLGLFAGAAYIAGLRIGLTGQALEIFIKALQSLVHSLGLVLAINGVILLALKLLMKIVRR